METAVIGAGYVGLVQAAGLAALGHRVRVGERSRERLAMLDAGEVPIYEPDLDRLMSEGVASGLLSFHGSNVDAVASAAVVFIAVPTPPAPDGSADTTIVEAVVDEIAPTLTNGALVVMKSTVPVGSAKRFQSALDDAGAKATVLSNPEFLREGSAVADFFHPDRIVVGTRSQEAAEVMIELYRGLDAPVVVTDPISSEMIKYGRTPTWLHESHSPTRWPTCASRLEQTRGTSCSAWAMTVVLASTFSIPALDTEVRVSPKTRERWSRSPKRAVTTSRS